MPNNSGPWDTYPAEQFTLVHKDHLAAIEQQRDQAITERDDALARLAEAGARINRLLIQPKRELDDLVGQMLLAEASTPAIHQRKAALLSKLGLFPGDLDPLH